VNGAYQILTSQAAHSHDALGDIVWHKHVPLKLSILAWRLLQDRLPTKNNLLRSKIIHQNAARCVAGCGHDETTSHLFIHCGLFSSLWQYIRSWLGVTGADPHSISDHFHQFIHCTGISRRRKSFLQLIWLLGVWLIWVERNNRIFNNIQTPMDQILDKVKFHSYWWLKAKKHHVCEQFREIVVRPFGLSGLIELYFCNYVLTLGLVEWSR
jgi:hypothetical protein